ncbi:MAG: hypothetical protein K0R24_1962 [Gammaproteobacteria bacterium]|jgi:hypothetical protein|nr:hypothetical protein [Gammaproteobacteria bacterium]
MQQHNADDHIPDVGNMVSFGVAAKFVLNYGSCGLNYLEFPDNSIRLKLTHFINIGPILSQIVFLRLAIARRA